MAQHESLELQEMNYFATTKQNIENRCKFVRVPSHTLRITLFSTEIALLYFSPTPVRHRAPKGSVPTKGRLLACENPTNEWFIPHNVFFTRPMACPRQLKPPSAWAAKGYDVETTQIMYFSDCRWKYLSDMLNLQNNYRPQKYNFSRERIQNEIWLPIATRFCLSVIFSKQSSKHECRLFWFRSLVPFITYTVPSECSVLLHILLYW